jgi:hypothetical protein
LTYARPFTHTADEHQGLVTADAVPSRRPCQSGEHLNQKCGLTFKVTKCDLAKGTETLSILPMPSPSRVMRMASCIRTDYIPGQSRGLCK